MSSTEGKYAKLLKDEHVLRWFKNLARGSPITAEVAARRLGKFCELMGRNPNNIVDYAKRDLPSLQDELEDLVATLESQGKSPGYIQAILKAVKSWLRYNDVKLIRKIKVANATATPTIENERVPSQEELATILRKSPPRLKVAIALIAFSDLRPQTLGNYNGSDGLRLKDLPEMKVENVEVKFEKYPTIIKVRSALSKAKHKYFTFLSKEGCTYLKEYLEERLRKGERFELDTPILAHERPTTTTKQFMITRKITHYIRERMRKAGKFNRPYVLRAYAETQLIIAESKGKISHPYLQFIAGHKGDIESRYSTNKGLLPPDMIEDMRKSYEQCEPFLGTTAQPADQRNVIKEAKIEALKSIAKTMFGIDLMEIKVARERELGKELTSDDAIELFENEVKKLREAPDPQKVIVERELENYLTDGWQYVTTLPSKRIVIKK